MSKFLIVHKNEFQESVSTVFHDAERINEENLGFDKVIQDHIYIGEVSGTVTIFKRNSLNNQDYYKKSPNGLNLTVQKNGLYERDTFSPPNYICYRTLLKLPAFYDGQCFTIGDVGNKGIVLLAFHRKLKKCVLFFGVDVTSPRDIPYSVFNYLYESDDQNLIRTFGTLKDVQIAVNELFADMSEGISILQGKRIPNNYAR